LIMLLSRALVDQGAGTRWTLYPPLSATLGHRGSRVDLAIVRLHRAGVRSILGAINFLVTMRQLRRETQALNQMRLFVWCVGVTAFLLVVALPVLAGAITMLLLDRNLNTSFFDTRGGGNALLYQHLF